MASPPAPAREAPASLDSPVRQLPRVGVEAARRLERLGIVSVGDLLHHLPRRYEDTRQATPLRLLQAGQMQTARVRLRSISGRLSSARRRRDGSSKRMRVTEAVLVDDDGGLATAVWFNQQFLERMLQPGMELMVSGLVQLHDGRPRFRAPTHERVGAEQRHVGRLAPVYPETEGISSRQLRAWIEPLLDLTAEVPDRLPPRIRADLGLMPIEAALRQVHRPDSDELREAARRRIAFEEMFLLQLAAERTRRRRLSSAGAVVPYDVDVARAFVASLPFTLTPSQRRSAHDILKDLAAPGPMNRLLQGEVGSGKTVVAAMAALMTASAGLQTAMMAPTEILARQHHATLTSLLAPHGLVPRLLVGSTAARARREILEAFAASRESLLVGTHTLIDEGVVFDDLALVVVDEQHRFGVAQRQQLRRKGSRLPNFLALTATPIPRSLALTLYGDVNLSELRELPPGRQPVETQVVPPHRRQAAYDFVRSQVQQGRQVFVICPLIEESDRLGVRSAIAEHARLRSEVFPDLRVELLHGRIPARAKEARMAAFAGGDIDVLVATSVIEVGVDVPNVSVMLIEGAERFGLAQLHQFRGRVGRGAHRSHCLLFQSDNGDEATIRLETVARTHDGFALADADLRLRGAGDVAGLRQHGLPEMRAADLLDVALAQSARAAAGRWLDLDPELLKHPPLAEAMHGYRAVLDLD